VEISRNKMNFVRTCQPLFAKSVPLPLLSRLHSEGLSERAITKELQHRGFTVSRSSVNRMLKSYQAKIGANSVVSRSDGKRLTDRGKRWVVRQTMVHNELSSRNKVAGLREMGVGVGRTTVYRALASNEYLVARRPRKGMYITKQHLLNRKEWVKERLAEKVDWSRVMFSDAKLWCLDGPAGRPKMWQDTRLPPVRIPTKGTRNAAVYVWAAFSLGKVPELSFPPSHYSAKQYCDMLGDQLQTHSYLKRYTLYHDRDPAHTAASTEEWLEAHNWKARHFPAKGADLNPMENIWAIMTRKIFGATTTFTSKKALRAAIKRAWHEIQQDKGLRRKLVASMQKRLVAVAMRKGGLISY
jgi:Fe2+ or Zn2+ uptake regulation protein